MEKVKITFELSKGFISRVMTVMNLAPESPAGRERLLAAMDAVTIDADEDGVLGDDTGQTRLTLALVAIDKTTGKLKSLDYEQDQTND